MATEKYAWKYCSIGGMTRVSIKSGEDIRHLGELDQKLWTVLSCPVAGLEFPEKTLKFIDSDNDGRIRVKEIVDTANWLCSVLKDPDLLLQGSDSLAISAFNQEDPQGKILHDSAKHILANLGLEKDSISIADTADSTAIFAGTRFNGDGVITPASTDDAELKATIEAIIASVGGSADRSGENGVNAAQIEAFYGACADYIAWRDASEADKENIFPYGEKTEEALAACESVKAKVKDWFTRCTLASYDENSAASLEMSTAKISGLADMDLSECGDQIAACPLAHIEKDGKLEFKKVNPAWKAAMEKVHGLLFPDKKSIDEAEWNEALARFDAYKAWKGSKKGAAVEGLGEEAVRGWLKAGRKADLDALVAEDLALEAEAKAIDNVDKFLWLFRDFYTLLKNYVTMPDFYDSWKGETKAIFQAGTLYIDQRSLDLCIKVADMGKQAEVVASSGMYLIYCNCTSKVKGQTMTIAAALTDGEVDNLRVGQNAVFYDRNGLDWDAVVTKIVDNPTSIRQAFWSPYRKLANTIQDRISKKAAEKESKVNAGLTEKANNAQLNTDPKLETIKSTFDIAKFAGIFAAIGMGVGFIGSAIAKLIAPWYNIFICFFVLVLVISGPSMFMAWLKLRKRNLGPVLNANGWAINSRLLVNIKFGATLTHLAKYPKIVINDPFAKKDNKGKKAIAWIVAILLVLGGLFAGHYFKGWFGKWNPISDKFKTEAVVTEAPADGTAAAEATAPAEGTAEAEAQSPAETVPAE